MTFAINLCNRVRNQLSNEKIEQIWLPLLEALEEGQFPHLKELDIGYNRLGREEIMRPRFEALQARVLRKILVRLKLGDRV